MYKTNFFKVISKQFSLKKPETFIYLAIVFILLYLVANYVLPSNMLFKENFELFNSSPSPSAMTSDNSTKLVYFYMNGCGHCNKFTPTWDKFCSANSSSIKTYKFEQAQVKEQITTYAISGFPTILLLDKNNAKIDEYNGERSVEALTSYVNGRASHS
jgi:thiol-disulfide isomerase/thioredoxin